MGLKDRGWVYVQWILLVQYRDQWRAVVRTVMNLFGVSKWQECLG